MITRLEMLGERQEATGTKDGARTGSRKNGDTPLRDLCTLP